MPLMNRTISNLFGGVSQQPAGIRLDNQCEEMVNAYPSITDGLVKRPPTEFIATLNPVLGVWDTVSMVAGMEGPNTLLDSASQFLIRLPGLASGHSILISGFSTPENNGTFPVVSCSASSIEVSYPPYGVQDEAAGNDISITDLGVI